MDLGYRVWYPHGFVYCPDCRKPLRHKLEYKINADGKTVFEGSVCNPRAYSAENSEDPKKAEWTCECGTVNNGLFCSQCGKKHTEGGENT